MRTIIYVVLASVIASISGILFGYDTGVISGALIFLKKDFVISSSQEGIIVGILLFGALIGAFLVGKIADKLGRKNLLIITSFLYIIGTLGLSTAQSLHGLYLFRFILGIPIGIASFATPSYISEIAPRNLRGFFVSLFQLAIVIGILITYGVNYFLADTTNAWRYMFFLGVIPAIILFMGLLFLPESPRWLIAKGKIQQAKLVLERLREANYQSELIEIQNTVELENNFKKSKWGNLFNKTNIPVITIAAMIMLFQQLSGIDAIIYYAPQIFMHVGLGIKNSLFSTVLIGLINLISTVIGLVLIDKLGRRLLMIYGSLLMAIALTIVAITVNMPTLSSITVAAVLAYIFAFATSTALVGWLIISEIFPLKVRGEGSALGVTFFWISNMLISFLFPIALQYVELSWIFGFFAMTCLLSLMYCIKYLPETKHVSLEVIERNLINGVRSIDLGKDV